MTGKNIKSKRGYAVISVFSLEQMLSAIPSSENKKAYYISTDTKGQSVFGIAGSSRMFYISPELYEKIGSPDDTKEIRVSFILEKAGYVGSSSQKN